MGVGALVGTEKETAVHCPFYWRGARGAYALVLQQRYLGSVLLPS